MRVKKVNIFNDIKHENLNSIETFFSISKNLILCPDFLEIVLSGRIKHLKNIILKGREFRGGSVEKMRRMKLGREIVGVVGLPPFVRQWN